MNFPNWNPPPGRFAGLRGGQPAGKHGGPVTREMWNQFLAQKRQSTTNVGAKTENKAQSVVNIEPQNGLVDAQVNFICSGVFFMLLILDLLKASFLGSASP